MCVRYARRGATRSIADKASATVKWVECGLSRSASMTRVSTPAMSGHDASGMALQSVSYANDPKRKPRIGIRPWKSGTGTTDAPPTLNGPSISCASIRGTPPPSRGMPSKA